MRLLLLILAAVTAMGCGGGGGGATNGNGQPQIPQLFAAKRYQRTFSVIPPVTNLTIVLDTAMSQGALTEAAAGLSGWVEGRAKDFRISLVATSATCGPGQMLVPFPPSLRDVEAERVAGAAALKAALANVQPTATRSTLGTLAALKAVSQPRGQSVILVTAGADQCGANAKEALEKLRRDQGLNTRLIAFQPDPTAADFLKTLSEAGGLVLNCPGRTDAECGPDNFCADRDNGRCDRTYRQATTGAGLTDVLLELTPVWDTPMAVCQIWFDGLKPQHRPSRAFINGLELKPDQWSYDKNFLTLKGPPCDKFRASTNFDPVTVEIEVPFSVQSL